MSTVDLQSNSWHTLDVLLVHITPKAKAMKGPSLKVVWLVCTVHADMAFKMDIKFVDSKTQKVHFAEWSDLSELELELRCRSEVFDLPKSALYHHIAESRVAARANGKAALELLRDNFDNLRPAKVAKHTRSALTAGTEYDTRKVAGRDHCVALLVRMSGLGNMPVIPFERSHMGAGEGEIHYNRSCGCPNKWFIHGDLYNCLSCEEDLCTRCYAAHNPSHPLTLIREAAPYTDDDTWTVTKAGVMAHSLIMRPCWTLMKMRWLHTLQIKISRIMQ